jgi:hypothetical protein
MDNVKSSFVKIIFQLECLIVFLYRNQLELRTNSTILSEKHTNLAKSILSKSYGIVFVKG